MSSSITQLAPLLPGDVNGQYDVIPIVSVGEIAPNGSMGVTHKITVENLAYVIGSNINPEIIMDTVAAHLVGGTGIAIVYDDLNDLLTISNTYTPPVGLLKVQNPLSTTLQVVQDGNNTNSQLYLATDKTQVQGTLRITTNNNPYIDAEDGATNNRFTVGRAPASQQVNVDFASNPTGSTTTVGAIRTYVDGTNLSEVMAFREDGNIGIGTTTPTSLLDVVRYTTGSVNNNYQFRVLNSADGQYPYSVVLLEHNNRTGVGNQGGASIVIKDGYANVNRAGLGFDYFNSGSYSSNGGNLRLSNDGQGNLLLSTNGVDALRIFKDQGVQIGGISTTLSSVARLLIKGSSSTSATTSLLVQNSAGTQVLKATDDGKLTIGTNTGNGGALLFQYPGITNGVYWGDDYGVIYGSITLSRSSGEMKIYAAGGGYFQTFYTQGNERMRIDTNGNVGIGTASPNARTHIVGSGSTSATTSLLVQNSSGNNALQITDDRSMLVSGNATLAGTNSLTGTTTISGTSSSITGIYSTWACQYSSSVTSKPLSFSAQAGGSTPNNTAIQFGFNFREAGGLWSQDIFQNILYSNTVGSVVTGFEWYTHQTQAGDISSQFAMSLRGKTLSIGTNTPSASAILQADSTTQGFLPPRMTNAQRVAITSPATGLQVYNTEQGLQVYNGTSWVTVGNGGGLINTNTAVGTEAGFSNTSGYNNAFLGYQAGYGHTSGFSNVAVGYVALQNNTTGYQNVAIGESTARYANGIRITAIGFTAGRSLVGTDTVAIGAYSHWRNSSSSSVAIGYASLEYNQANGNTAVGNRSLNANTSGAQNVAVGADSLFNNTTGGYSVAVGYQALQSNTTGANNTAIGRQSLYSNTTGGDNTAVGFGSLADNTTGASNTAIGTNALRLNTTASYNTAVGYAAGYNNTSGDITVFGYLAGFSNTSGNQLTAVGNNAARNHTTGGSNTAIGSGAMYSVTSATFNTAVGQASMFNMVSGGDNTAVGRLSLYSITTGQGNTAIGTTAMFTETTGSYNTAIGAGTNAANFSNSTLLGAGATATANNQFVVGSAAYNAGAVTNEVNSSTKVWNVKINGVDYKILLA